MTKKRTAKPISTRRKTRCYVIFSRITRRWYSVWEWSAKKACERFDLNDYNCYVRIWR